VADKFVIVLPPGARELILARLDPVKDAGLRLLLGLTFRGVAERVRLGGGGPTSEAHLGRLGRGECGTASRVPCRSASLGA